MSKLEISLFGRFHVQCARQDVEGFESYRVQQLLCYLLLYRLRPHPREALADLLWSDSQTDQPNRCLRKTLWQLRNALLSETIPCAAELILVDPGWICVNPEVQFWLDVAEFERAYARARRTPGRELNAQDIKVLQGAADLYRGGLQESWYQDWYLYEQERFRHMYLVILDKLVDYFQAHQAYEEGIAYGERILRCDRASERTHRRLMQLYALAGNRTEALRQYERCRCALDEELGVQPATSTVKLHRRIQQDQFGRSEPAIRSACSATCAPLLKTLECMRHLESILAQAQDRLRDDIGDLEQTPPRKSI